MGESVNLLPTDAEELVLRALMANKISKNNAKPTARALVNAEIDGQKGHGLSRVSFYVAQAQAGKVNGFAKPTLEQVGPATARVDAAYGFAYPAFEQAIPALINLTKRNGVGVVSVYHSHHFGQAGAHVEQLALKGMIGLLFGNSPKGIAFWGGKSPMMGTNPIAFAAPVQHGEPLVIDLAIAKVARGKIVVAKETGQSIPAGWALDEHGIPTTDPKAALSGSMLPIGDAKGAALALMVEILAAALTNSHFGFEASSLFDAKGKAPDLGQCLLAIDPGPLSAGQFYERLAVLIKAVENENGARLPGISRLKNRTRVKHEGIEISSVLYDEIKRAAQTRDSLNHYQ